MANLIYPEDMVFPNKVDYSFVQESKESQKSGILVSLLAEDFNQKGERSFRIKRAHEGNSLLRDWMHTPSEYAAIFNAAKRSGVNLVTTPSQYMSAHYLPGWYSIFSDYTPKSTWRIKSDQRGNVAENYLPREVDTPLIVKDFVKSRKHEWDTACYVPNPESLGKVVNRFFELHEYEGTTIEGGMVFREFEEFDSSVGEIRCWWVNGKLVLESPHPNTDFANFTVDPSLTKTLAPLVEKLGNPFISMDIAVRGDGVMRVMEIGDGQVSGLVEDFDATPLWNSLISL